jgi:hypothetical protein
MVHDVRVTLPALQMLYGGKVAHDLAEELLLISIAMIEKTAGKARALATLRNISKALAPERRARRKPARAFSGDAGQ